MASVSSSCAFAGKSSHAIACSASPQRRGDRRGDVLLAVGVAAGELDDRQRRLAPIERGADRLRDEGVRVGERGGLADRAHERLQARIEVVDPGEVMQHALVDPQPRGDERAVVGGLDQPPAPQRTQRGERAPVRVGQHRKRQPEVRVRPARTPGGTGAQTGELRVHLDASDEQEQIAFEAAEAEALRDPVDGGRRRQRIARAPGLLAPQEALQPRELGDQEALIGLGPVVAAVRRVHWMSIRCGRNAGGVAAWSTIGPSTPSTRSRAR